MSFEVEAKVEVEVEWNVGEVGMRYWMILDIEGRLEDFGGIELWGAFN